MLPAFKTPFRPASADSGRTTIWDESNLDYAAEPGQLHLLWLSAPHHQLEELHRCIFHEQPYALWLWHYWGHLHLISIGQEVENSMLSTLTCPLQETTGEGSPTLARLSQKLYHSIQCSRVILKMALKNIFTCDTVIRNPMSGAE